MFDIKHVYQDPITLTAVAVGVGAASTIHSIQQQKKSAKNQKKAQQAQQRIQEVKAARERRKQVREAQVAQAQVEAGAQASGVTQTSAAVGGAGSIQTQLGSNLSFLDQVGELTQQTSIFNQRAASASSRAATSQAVAGLGLQGASIFAAQIPPTKTG